MHSKFTRTYLWPLPYNFLIRLSINEKGSIGWRKMGICEKLPRSLSLSLQTRVVLIKVIHHHYNELAIAKQQALDKVNSL